MSKKLSNEEKEYLVLKKNIEASLKTRPGKEMLWFVLELCEIYGETFTGNSHTFYREGRRSVGIDILAMLDEIDPTIYPRLILEKCRKEKSNAE